MIYATGIDIVEHKRIEHIYKRYGENFIHRILHPEERKEHYTIAYIASRFAVKEAALKALQTGFQYGIQWKDIVTLKGIHQQPELVFYGKAKERANTLNIQKICVSISHEKKYSVAFVLLEHSCF